MATSTFSVDKDSSKEMKEVFPLSPFINFETCFAMPVRFLLGYDARIASLIKTERSIENLKQYTSI